MKFAFPNGMKKKFFALDKATKLIKKNENGDFVDADVLEL